MTSVFSLGNICPICAAASTKPRHSFASVYLPSVSYTIRHCISCGHHFACGPADASTLASVYGEAFHVTSQQAGVRKGSPVITNARRRAGRLAAVGLRGRLLDIGAGRGYFVDAAGAYFDAVGLEYSPDAVHDAQAANRPVIAGYFPEQCPAGPFDVITLWDVLAGFVDPHAAIAGIREHLTSGGRVIFTTPWISAPFARWTGRYWPLWIPPVNLHYFSRQSLGLLLEAHGLRIIHCGPESKRVAVDFLVRKAFRAIRLNRLADRVGGIPKNWSVELDLGDIFTVHAERLPETSS